MEKIPYDELVYIKTQIFDKIHDTLPTDMANATFTAFKRLFPQDTMSQPCTCSSAGKYWGEIIKRSKEELEKQLAEYLVAQEEDVNLSKSKKSRKKTE